jgi:hypothetical protein
MREVKERDVTTGAIGAYMLSFSRFQFPEIPVSCVESGYENAGHGQILRSWSAAYIS